MLNRPKTAQEVFDRVATHLLKQSTKAAYDGNCLYRAPDGLKCAVGCLIADEEYHPAMEGRSIGARLFEHPERFPQLHWMREYVKEERGPSGEYGGLLPALQRVHDTWPVEEWPERLRSVAGKFNLSTEVLDAR